ncbi:MAG: polysaccharide biosynthesis tyrosine autokinase, partial [candidate division WOR-3 bacterium]
LDPDGRKPTTAFNATAAPAVASLRDELARLEAERTSLLVQGYTDSSPRIAAIGERTRVLKEQLRAAVAAFLAPAGPAEGLAGVADVASRIGETQAELVRLEASEHSLSEIAADCESRLSQLPLRERQLARLTRDVQVDRQVHALLAQRYEETRIQEAGRLSSVTIVDPPLPGKKVKPDLRHGLLLAFALGLAVAFAGVWSVDRLDTRIRRPEDLERYGATCIAAIPRLAEGLPVGQLGEDCTAAGPVSARLPDSVVAEAFRVLRTNVQFAAAAAETRLRTVIVTSADACEGKTTVAGNLAVVLAHSGKRVLLMDADLRKPKQHSVFRQRKKPGLTDAVMLGAPLEQAVRPSPVEGLDLLFAGTTPPSPVDFLNSPALASFLKHVGEQYDCVVVDTPPVLVSSDAAILASKADGVLLVARLGKTDLRALAEARRLLDQAGSRLLGIVANEQRPRRRYGYYRYRYRYYHYRATNQPVA